MMSEESGGDNVGVNNSGRHSASDSEENDGVTRCDSDEEDSVCIDDSSETDTVTSSDGPTPEVDAAISEAADTSHLTPRYQGLALEDLAAICSERVSQMTKTFNDIEAVTRLLEEKERDLELAARIGQTLLDRNKSLSEKNDQLEAEVSECHDKINQLKHDLTLKENLLQVYTRDEYAETEEGSTAAGDKDQFNETLVTLEGLQRKVQWLEEENLRFTSETARLNLDTLDYEEKEEKLVKDLIGQLSENNDIVKYLTEEVSNKSDVNLRQQEEITSLLGKNVVLDNKVKKLSAEKQELHNHLSAAQDAQKELSSEINDLHEKYAECLALLHAANEEIKILRSKHRPRVTHQIYTSFSPFLPSDSLASELESEFRKDLDLPPGESPSERRSHTQRVLETVKAVNKSKRTPASSSRNSISSLHAPSLSFQSTSGHETCESSVTPSNRSSFYLSESESFDGYGADVDSTYGSFTNLGRPGTPGSNDLETALRRLSLRRANELSEQSYHEEERRRQESESTATPPRTPDSVISTGSALSDFSRMSGVSGYSFRMPQKLQIVKPLEGSATLLQWQRLATPHMGGILDARPGVFNKGTDLSECEDEVYNISDIEEDDIYQDARRMDDTTSTYTLTQAKVLHPAYCSLPAKVPSAQTSSHVTPTLTDQSAQHNSTKTFSMSFSLANSLNERDIIPFSEQNGLNQFLSPSNPVRFHSITTETMSESMRSATEAIYTSASSMTETTINQSIMAQSSGGMFAGVDLSALNIVDKIKNLSISRVGLASIASIIPIKMKSPQNSRTSTPRLPRKIYNTDHVGLNVVQGFKAAPSSANSRSELTASSESLSSISTVSSASSVATETSLTVPSVSTSVNPSTSGLNGILALAEKPHKIRSGASQTMSATKRQLTKTSANTSRGSSPALVAKRGTTKLPPGGKKSTPDRHPTMPHGKSGLNSILGLSASAKHVEKPAKSPYTCSTCTAGVPTARLASTSTVSALPVTSRLSPSVAARLPSHHNNKSSLTDCLKTTT